MMIIADGASPLPMFDGPSQGLSIIPGHPTHWRCWGDAAHQPHVYEDLDTGEAWAAGDVVSAAMEYPHWGPYEQPPWSRDQSVRVAMGAMRRASPLYVHPGPSGYPLPVAAVADLIELGDLDEAKRIADGAPSWAHHGGYSTEYGVWLVIMAALAVLRADERNRPYAAGNVWRDSVRLHWSAADLTSSARADRMERRAMLQDADLPRIAG